MNNDLISRSALQAVYDKECAGGCGNCPHSERDYSCDLISAAPAVDAEPVRHGRWIEHLQYDDEGYLYICYACSECGRIELYEKEPYCHCGAKMDLEVKE